LKGFKKNIMKKFLVFSFALISLSNFAQEKSYSDRNPRSATLGFAIQGVQPIGEYADHYNGNPVGLSGTFSHHIKQLPFDWGVQFSWNQLGALDQDISVYGGTNLLGDSIFNDGTYRVRHNNYRYQGLLRFRPFNGFFQPYAEGLAGVETFSTKTDISVQNSGGFSSVEEAKVQQSSTSLLYGYALGFRFRTKNARRVWFDIRYENIQGGKAQYIIPETVTVQNNTDLRYTTGTTKTNRQIIQFGLTFGF
jgi:hypothetical protein